LKVGIICHRKVGDVTPYEDTKGTKWLAVNSEVYGSGGSTVIVTNAELEGTTKVEVAVVFKHNDGEEVDDIIRFQMDISEKLVGVENMQSIGWMTDGFYFSDGTSDFNERNAAVARYIQDKAPPGVQVEIRGRTTGRRQKKNLIKMSGSSSCGQAGPKQASRHSLR
jgi:hypothetical protein